MGAIIKKTRKYSSKREAKKIKACQIILGECAEKAKADLIVTGDKHLIKLGSYKEGKTLKLADFIYLLEKKGEKN